MAGQPHRLAAAPVRSGGARAARGTAAQPPAPAHEQSCAAKETLSFALLACAGHPCLAPDTGSHTAGSGCEPKALPSPGAQAALAFLDEKLAAAAGGADRPAPPRPALPLPAGALAPILAALAKHAAPLSPEAAAAVARVTAEAGAAQAALATAAPPAGADAAAPGPAPAPAPAGEAEPAAAAAGPPSGFKKEVEDDANLIFQQARPWRARPGGSRGAPAGAQGRPACYMSRADLV